MSKFRSIMSPSVEASFSYDIFFHPFFHSYQNLTLISRWGIRGTSRGFLYFLRKSTKVTHRTNGRLYLKMSTFDFSRICWLDGKKIDLINADFYATNCKISLPIEPFFDNFLSKQ